MQGGISDSCIDDFMLFAKFRAFEMYEFSEVAQSVLVYYRGHSPSQIGRCVLSWFHLAVTTLLFLIVSLIAKQMDRVAAQGCLRTLSAVVSLIDKAPL